MSDQSDVQAENDAVNEANTPDTATTPLGDGSEPHEPETASDRVTDPVAEAAKEEAASNPQSDTIENGPVNADTGPDRSAEAGRIRPSVPDQYAGVAEPSTDPDKTTSF